MEPVFSAPRLAQQLAVEAILSRGGALLGRKGSVQTFAEEDSALLIASIKHAAQAVAGGASLDCSVVPLASAAHATDMRGHAPAQRRSTS